MFEFQCTECGHQFEELVMEDEKPACPACGAAETEKLLSACRARVGGAGGEAAPSSCSGGGCAGCSGGNCASCR